ncbi:MAG: hypothetical protein R3B09_31395 [Nannocystaceae bacterium]
MQTRAPLGTVVIVIGCAALLGCGKPKARESTPPPTVDASGGVSDAATLPGFDISGDDVAARDAKTVGATKENPVPSCGPDHSYDYIASDVVCADGKSPLRGDLEAAMAARVGNVGPNEAMHIIDLYEIHCPEGPKAIYVDMDDCENAHPTRSQLELDRLINGVTHGEYKPFIERCGQEAGRGAGRISTVLKACVPSMPAILGAAGDPEGARSWLKQWCLGAPLEPGASGDPPRYVYLDNVLSTAVDLAEARGIEAAQAASERQKRTPEYARICEIEPAAFEKWRKGRSREE